MATSLVQVRIDEELKNQATAIPVKPYVVTPKEMLEILQSRR